MRISSRLLMTTTLAFAASAALAAGAGAATFVNSSPIVIPQQGNANPYPSQITVTGLNGPITDLNVNLNGLTHNAPGDLRGALVGPAGQSLALWACVGNDTAPGASNANVKLDDSSGIRLPTFPSPVASGTYKPTNHCVSAPSFPSPGPLTSYANPGPASGGAATLASVFNGNSANGTWSLFFFDAFSGESGQFAGGWSLELTTAAKKKCKKGRKLKKGKCVKKKKKKKKKKR